MPVALVSCASPVPAATRHTCAALDAPQSDPRLPFANSRLARPEEAANDARHLRSVVEQEVEVPAVHDASVRDGRGERVAARLQVERRPAERAAQIRVRVDELATELCRKYEDTAR